MDIYFFTYCLFNVIVTHLNCTYIIAIFLYYIQRFASCNVIIPEPCGEGTYRNGAMTSCETCDDGLTPNSDKTACGKITLKLIFNIIVMF